ncbi:hypothetical protein GGH95_001092 [Coemansia sp. RSA 1836]|nr:hypothetical protein IWW47_001373 [Coemansia sp. RSA 2052]KAJ2583262.1 hypothetical protein GGH95_001092 [Coemansia sp. RSA 1836]
MTEKGAATATASGGIPQAIFIAQARQRTGAQQPVVVDEAEVVRPAPAERSEADTSSRLGSAAKSVCFAWFGWWFIRYFEIDRSLRGEPDTPHISMFWLYLALIALLPFLGVYFYASVWRRRVLGEPLDLQDWQASANSLVHYATVGLLFAWAFATIALFPGFGVKSIVIVAVTTVTSVALAGAVEGIF